MNDRIMWAGIGVAYLGMLISMLGWHDAGLFVALTGGSLGCYRGFYVPE